MNQKFQDLLCTDGGLYVVGQPIPGSSRRDVTVVSIVYNGKKYTVTDSAGGTETLHDQDVARTTTLQ